MTDAPHAVVIGAGVVGLCCASHLQQRGYRVTIVDPRSPGEYCSRGNAGCFSRASCVPLGLPGFSHEEWDKFQTWRRRVTPSLLSLEDLERAGITNKPDALTPD